MHQIVSDFNESVPGHKKGKGFKKAFDRLLSDIWFVTEEEARLPQNVEKTKNAVMNFLDDRGWQLAKWCFEELLEEKSGQFAYRADNVTPNWYHELRQSLYFLAMVREGIIKKKDIEPYGGMEVALGIIFTHDSWEDFGKSRVRVYMPLERKLHQAVCKSELTQLQFRQDLRKAAAITQGMDYLTRKAPQLLDDGRFALKPSGKYVKIDRFDGDLNLYYNGILESPLTAIFKFCDAIEGMSTRIGVSAFSMEDDRLYREERRMLYGRRALDEQVIRRYPFLKDAIRTADSMLGILLVQMETLSDYGPDRKENPRYATPMRIDQYLKHGYKGFEILPPGWHPLYISMERLRAKAELEGEGGRCDLIIRQAMLPSLVQTFPKLLYPNPSYRDLPAPSVSDPR